MEIICAQKSVLKIVSKQKEWRHSYIARPTLLLILCMNIYKASLILYVSHFTQIQISGLLSSCEPANAVYELCNGDIVSNAVGHFCCG